MKRANTNEVNPATQLQFQPVDLRSIDSANEFTSGPSSDQASFGGAVVGTTTVGPTKRVKLVRQSDIANKAKSKNVRPAIIRPAPAGMDSRHAGGIVRQDGPSLTPTKSRPAQRLEGYVRQLEDLHPKKRTEEAATQAIDVAKSLSPPEQKKAPEKGPSELAKLEAAALRRQSFVSKTNFDSAAKNWGAPKILQTMDLADSIMQNQHHIKRVDTSHGDGRQFGAHLGFSEDQTQVEAGAKPDETPPKPKRELTFNEQAEILNDPQTQDLVALISSAIASVLNEESEEEVLPQAMSIFEKNLQQHAVMLESDQASTDAPDAGISDAMVDSIAAQRETNAQISETVSPTALADQLRHKIALHQQAQAKNEVDVKVSEIESVLATDDFERSTIEFVSTAPTAAGATIAAHTEKVEIEADETPQLVDAEDPVDVEQLEDVEAAPPIVSFTKPEESMIPLSAAAWDVEDFRWPAVADQMIVDGGEAIGQLLNATLMQTQGSPKRIAVSGAGRSQGATTISITLARWAAACGLKTLIVDADVANPSLSGRVGLSSNLSWLNGINKDTPSSELIIRSRKTNLCLMPLAVTVTRVTWPRFIFDNLGELLAPVSEHFDLILIDSGPASQLLDELSNPGLMIDGAVLVDSTASAKELDVYQTRLTTFGIESLVLAENRKVEAASNVA
jgi:Mrp family chromosome partitioning ATPase